MQRIPLLVGMLALSAAFAGCIASGSQEPAPQAEPPDAVNDENGAVAIINGVRCAHEPRSVTLLDWLHAGDTAGSGSASFDMPAGVPLVEVRMRQPTLVAGDLAVRIAGPTGEAYAHDGTGVRTGSLRVEAGGSSGHWDPDHRAPGMYTMTWDMTGVVVDAGLKVVAQVCV